MKVQNSCVPTSGRRADNDLNLRHQHQTNQTHCPIPIARYDTRPIPGGYLMKRLPNSAALRPPRAPPLRF